VPMLRVVQHEFPGRASGDHRWTKTTETKTRTCPRDREMSPGGVADGSDWSEPAEYVGYGHVVDSDDEG
jgi:hypothetical protein